MQDEEKTLNGWPAARKFLMLAFTPVLTALVMSIPIRWLVNHVFAVGAVQEIFGVERLDYWRTLGLFAICYATRIRVGIHGPQK